MIFERINYALAWHFARLVLTTAAIATVALMPSLTPDIGMAYRAGEHRAIRREPLVQLLLGSRRLRPDRQTRRDSLIDSKIKRLRALLWSCAEDARM